MMAWGCFASSSTGNLQHVEGKVDSVKYQEILPENLMPSVRKLGHHWTFQRENACCKVHQGLVSEEALEDFRVDNILHGFEESGCGNMSEL